MTATAQATETAKAQFLEVFEREHQTTLRVLRAYPAGKESLKPHPRCKSAIDLAWVFAGEMGMLLTGLTTGFDWSNPPSMPPAPGSMDEIITAFDGTYQKVLATVSGMSEGQLTSETTPFPSGPGKMGHPTKLQFLWLVLFDQIHHRGQFSVYLRMADGKVPSIYGPSADEPWM